MYLFAFFGAFDQVFLSRGHGVFYILTIAIIFIITIIKLKQYRQ